MRRSSRVAAVLAVLAILSVAGAFLASWPEILTRYHLRALRADPRKLERFLVQPEGTAARTAAIRYQTEALRMIIDLEADSCHAFLREASRLGEAAFQGKTCEEVRDWMRSKSLAALERGNGARGVYSRYLLRRKAFMFSTGHSLDLYVMHAVWNEDAVSGHRAEVALLAEIDAPHEDVMGQKRYPPGSLLDLALSSDEARAAGEVWPLLSDVWAHHRSTRNRWTEETSSSFHVVVQFAAVADEDIAGKEIRFEAFEAANALGRLRQVGVSEWWQGPVESMEANRRKYLRTRP